MTPKDKAGYLDGLTTIGSNVRAYYEYTLLGAEGDEPEPCPELLYYFAASAYSALPWGGGIQNQPHILMSQLAICGNIHDEIQGAKDANDRAEEEARRRKQNGS